MTTNTNFSGSIPENYDKYLGPFLFEFAAEDIAARVAKRVPEGGEVLEIAAGTGVSTEQLRAALPESVHIVATDVSEGMLAVAKEKRGHLKNVRFEAADAMALPFAAGRFDAVVCQFGLMFFPDKEHCLKEMYRVLQPGGIAAVSVWDSLENNPVIDLASRTLSKFFENEPPKFLQIPFGLHDKTKLTELFQSAGFSAAEVHEVAVEHDAVSAADMARGMVTGNPTIMEIEKHATADGETVIKAVSEAITNEFGGKGEHPRVRLQELTFIASKA